VGLPFPAAVPNLLTPDATLQGHLTSAISSVVGASPLRAAVAIAAISEAPTPPHSYRYAGVRDTEMHYSASLLKVAGMYAAFQMLESINQFGNLPTFQPLLGPVMTQAAVLFDPQIAVAVPSLATDPEITAQPLLLQAEVVRVKYGTMFDANADGRTVSFKPAFFARIKGAIVDSNNGDAGAVVKALGYAWLNGSLARAGLLALGPAVSGVWLAGTYDQGLVGAWPVARVNTLNDQGVGQAMTCFEMMKFYAAMDSGVLVDGVSSNPAIMIDLLRQAQATGPDPSFLTRGSVLAGVPVSYDVTHTKIGLGPLKPANGGFDVASEGTVIRHRVTSKRYIVVFQNSRNLNTSLNALSRIVDKTLRLDLGLP
jgi:hypothetical protein